MASLRCARIFVGLLSSEGGGGLGDRATTLDKMRRARLNKRRKSIDPSARLIDMLPEHAKEEAARAAGVQGKVEEAAEAKAKNRSTDLSLANPNGPRHRRSRPLSAEARLADLMPKTQDEEGGNKDKK